MDGDKTLIDESLESVFHDLVTTALAEQAVTTSTETEFYLVRMLGGFAAAGLPASFNDALGLELAAASRLEPGLRYFRLKELADTTLFLTGMFLDQVEKRLAATEYYFELGRRAYLDLGTLDDGYTKASDGFGQTYLELGERFEDFARVLTAIADREVFPVRKRLMTLYRRWMETGTYRHQRRLVAAGMPIVGAEFHKKH